MRSDMCVYNSIVLISIQTVTTVFHGCEKAAAEITGGAGQHDGGVPFHFVSARMCLHKRFPSPDVSERTLFAIAHRDGFCPEAYPSVANNRHEERHVAARHVLPDLSVVPAPTWIGRHQSGR